MGQEISSEREVTQEVRETTPAVETKEEVLRTVVEPEERPAEPTTEILEVKSDTPPVDTPTVVTTKIEETTFEESFKTRWRTQMWFRAVIITAAVVLVVVILVLVLYFTLRKNNAPTFVEFLGSHPLTWCIDTKYQWAEQGSDKWSAWSKPVQQKQTGVNPLMSIPGAKANVTYIWRRQAGTADPVAYTMTPRGLGKFEDPNNPCTGVALAQGLVDTHNIRVAHYSDFYPPNYRNLTPVPYPSNAARQSSAYPQASHTQTSAYAQRSAHAQPCRTCQVAR